MMNPHPVQLLAVEVEDLNISVLDRQKFVDVDYPKDFDYTVYSTEFNEANSVVRIKVELNVKPATDGVIDRPFVLKVGVAGVFSVDTARFPAEMVKKFAMHNAPIVLLPYVREHAFALSQRAGFEAIILPLVEVPTFKIVAAEELDK